MSEQLSAEEREALADGLRSPDGCWGAEECCWASFDAMVPAVEAILTTRTADLSARLASVEALADEWRTHIRSPWVRPGWSGGAILADLIAILHPEPLAEDAEGVAAWGSPDDRWDGPTPHPTRAALHPDSRERDADA